MATFTLARYSEIQGETFSGLLASARSKRELGCIPEAAALLERLAVLYPNDIACNVERLLFALETQQDRLAIDQILKLTASSLDAETARIVGLASVRLFNQGHAPSYILLGGPEMFYAPRCMQVHPWRTVANPRPIAIDETMKIPVTDGSIATLLSFDILGYVPENVQARCLDEVYRVMQDAGFFICRMSANSAIDAFLTCKKSLVEKGFYILSESADEILRRFAYFPTLAESHLPQNMYLVAGKA